MNQPIDILQKYWSYQGFKPGQEEIIDSVIRGRDVFALLPTGGGKSVCYQVPTMMTDGLCIVISPLIALMKDQVKSLKQKGIKALALTSDYSANEIDTMLDNCIYGNYKFLYCSPERLQQDLVQSRIRQMRVTLIAVDEAHCISSWGHDFRPAYRNINIIREYHPACPVIALTATARPEVVNDIILELRLDQPEIFQHSFRRDKLALDVFTESDKYDRLIQLLEEQPGSSIVYMRNRRSTVALSEFLNAKGITAASYHGGMHADDKQKNYDAWMNNRIRVMVATNAFGMGIDKSDVRTVVHFNLPESLESYYQEAGRAGRDGQLSHANILKNEADEDRIRNQFLRVMPGVDFIKSVYRKLCTFFQIAYGEGYFQTFDFDYNEFCDRYQLNPALTYNSLQVLDRNSIINLSPQFRQHAEVKILVSKDELFDYIGKNETNKSIVLTMLRTYGGLFDVMTRINTKLISKKVDLPEKKVIARLDILKNEDLIEMNLAETDVQITFTEPREDDKTINRISAVIKQQNRRKKMQVEAVIDFIENETDCRQNQVLAYFGEKIGPGCGICSVCRSKQSSHDPGDKRADILSISEALSEGELNSREIIRATRINKERVKTLIRLMLEKEIIEVTETNTYKLLK